MTTGTEKTQAEKLAELKALLSQFDAAAVRQLLKTTEAEKPTLLSITMDCIVAAGLAGAVVTDNVAKAVTGKAIAALVLKEGETASQTSVASLIRYANAYDGALKRAGLEIVKSETDEPGEQPGDTTGEGDKPASEPASEGEKTGEPETPPAPELPRNANRKQAA